jgi:hypothetical protein
MTETTETEEIRLRRVTVHLCEPCLNGEGGECHTPGCALWMNRAPDVGVITYEDIYHSLTRDKLAAALTRLDVRVLTDGPCAGMINADAMAGAILEALHEASTEGKTA